MGSVLGDCELLAGSVTEPALFAVLYDRHGLAVRRYVARRVGDDAGDDLASEVFIRAFRARARFRAEHASALPWLLGIANNVIADHRRLERRRFAALERMTQQTAAPVESNDVGVAAELIGALRMLPAVERDTFLLVVWGEVTQEEAAVALGVPVGTVSSRMTRARKRLEAALASMRPALPGGIQLDGDANVRFD